MKKLLGLTALAAVFVLAACGGGSGSSSADETVCSMDMMGMNMVITVQADDGDITSAELEVRLPLDSFGLEAGDVDLESDEITGMLSGMGFDGDVSLDGDYLVVTESGTAAELSLDSDLDEFIAEAESMGGTCE